MNKNNDGSFSMGKIQIVHIWAEPEIIGNKELIKRMLSEVVIASGMTPYGDPTVIEYPCPELGNTIAQAFTVQQTLYQSYVQFVYPGVMVYDNWVEKKPYAYSNLIVNSCKVFENQPIVDTIVKVINPIQITCGMDELYNGDPEAFWLLDKCSYRRPGMKRFAHD